ncbi:MAG: CAP domain-containing protein [Phormidesmis sp. RL_2_1]|nr:CAP domain-containing protein [Phormidesmis sp. RL_2_1]
MKSTAWWSVVLIGLLVTSCGSNNISSNNINSNKPIAIDYSQSQSSTNIDCAGLKSVFSELLSLTNNARTSAGVDSLQLSFRLGQAAQAYAEELGSQNFFSHTGLDGSTLSSRLSAANYPFVAAGENLAAGQETALSVFQGWMQSDSHRTNILRTDFTEVGFGLFRESERSDYDTYWVQIFGQPQSSSSRTEAYIPPHCGTSDAENLHVKGSQVAGVFVQSSDNEPNNHQSNHHQKDNHQSNNYQKDNHQSNNHQSNNHQKDSHQKDSHEKIIGNASIGLTTQKIHSSSSKSVPEPTLLLGIAIVGLMLSHNLDRR